MPKGRSRPNKPRKYCSSTLNKPNQIKKKISEQHSVQRLKYSGFISQLNSISTPSSKNDIEMDIGDYPCGICMKPVTDNDEAILCDSGDILLFLLVDIFARVEV